MGFAVLSGFTGVCFEFCGYYSMVSRFGFVGFWILLILCASGFAGMLSLLVILLFGCGVVRVVAAWRILRRVVWFDSLFCGLLQYNFLQEVGWFVVGFGNFRFAFGFEGWF